MTFSESLEAAWKKSNYFGKAGLLILGLIVISILPTLLCLAEDEFLALVALIIVGSIALLILWGAVSCEFGKIAENKGYSFYYYFWLTFWMTSIGILAVIALPDRATQQKLNDELPEL